MRSSVTIQLVNFVTRIAESKTALWRLTLEAKVTKKQAEDIVRDMKE